jgi:hypothetical protein
MKGEKKREYGAQEWCSHACIITPRMRIARFDFRHQILAACTWVTAIVDKWNRSRNRSGDFYEYPTTQELAADATARRGTSQVQQTR